MTEYLYLLPYALLALWLFSLLYRDRTAWIAWVIIIPVFMLIAAGSGRFFGSAWIAGTITAVIIVVVMELIAWLGAQLDDEPDEEDHLSYGEQS